MSGKSILHLRAALRGRVAASLMPLALVVFCAFTVAACGSGQDAAATTTDSGGAGSPGTEASGGGEVTVTDDGGRQVVVPSQVGKVFCTSPLGTYMVYTLAPEKLAGWNTKPSALEQAYIPEQYRPTVGLGGWYGKNTTGNVEEIIKIGPDLILSVGDMDDTNVSDADRVQDLLNIPVVLVDAKLVKSGDAYRFIGELLGEQERAGELARYSDKVIGRAQAIAAQIPEQERVTVYYAEGAKGLNTDPEGSTHTEVFTLIGAHNVADVEMQEGYGMSPVSLEQVIAWDPAFVFVASDPEGELNVYEKITTGGDWNTIQAVEDGHVYQIPHGPFDWLDRPYSIARLLGLQWVGDLVYPELWDLDIKETTKEFYRLFYHYDLSDTQLEELMQHALAVE